MGLPAPKNAVLRAPNVAAQDAIAQRAPGLPEGEVEPRGIVLITVDTLRADHVSLYGNSRMLTLNFERLMSGGVLFRQCIVQATTTSPSHASLMTGLYPEDHNVYSNFEALGDTPVTMAEAFKARGFATFALVNMRHLNPEVVNLDQGFDTFIKSGNMRRASTSVDKFLGWLDTLDPKQPFFAWIHLADVHTPYHPPPPYDHFYYNEDERDPHKNSLQHIWPLLPTNMSDHPLFLSWLEGVTDLFWVFAQYDGAVSYVDNEVGRLLDALEERRLLGRTAMVLTADHGESLGEHGMYFVHTGLFEPTVHVPLITYFPGTGRQGTEVRDVVQSVDVMPTVLEYFHVPVPGNLRGQSLWPLIRGSLSPERVAFIEHAGHNQVALRSDRYKYIRHLRTAHLQPSYPFVAGKEELYDLRQDPSERQNIAALRPEVVRMFRREYEVRRKDRMNLQAGTAEVDRETLEVLRSLGYVR